MLVYKKKVADSHKETVLIFVAIMNKLFILALFFLVAAVSAQPPQMPQNQCQAYKETALGLAKYMERYEKGEVGMYCINCT